MSPLEFNRSLAQTLTPIDFVRIYGKNHPVGSPVFCNIFEGIFGISYIEFLTKQSALRAQQEVER